MYQKVIEFWFEELEPKQWFVKDLALDKEIAKRFGDTHQQAKAGELSHWRCEPVGRLAEVIVLDQFSRNIFRDSAQAFETDNLALVLAQEAIAARQDKKLDDTKKSFLYMPFMHSESEAIHKMAVELFSQPGLEGNLDFEIQHKVIIERFGRYPHRNKILGRESTAEEVEFLQQPGSSF